MNRPLKALIVDDDEAVRRGCTRALKSVNCTADATGEALHGFHLAVSNDYDAILLDLKLAAVNGIGILQELRRTKPDVPVLVITGYPDMAASMMTTDCGPRELLAKPFTPEQLAQAVLRLTSAEPEAAARIVPPHDPGIWQTAPTGTAAAKAESEVSPFGRGLAALFFALVLNPFALGAAIILATLLIVTLEGVGSTLKASAPWSLQSFASVGLFVFSLLVLSCIALGQLITAFVEGWRRGHH